MKPEEHKGGTVAVKVSLLPNGTLVAVKIVRVLIRPNVDRTVSSFHLCLEEFHGGTSCG